MPVIRMMRMNRDSFARGKSTQKIRVRATAESGGRRSCQLDPSDQLAGELAFWVLHRKALTIHEVAESINTAQLQDRVAHRRFYQHSKISAGRHLNSDFADRQAEHVDRLAFQRQPLKFTVWTTHKLNDQLELHFPPNGGFTKDGLDIKQAEAADFQQVLQQRRASAFDKIRAEAHEVYGVVSDKTVTAADQLKPEFAFAETGVTGQQHAHAEDVEEHAVQRGARSKNPRHIEAQAVDHRRR